MKKIDIHVHVIPRKGIERITGGTFVTPGELRVMYDEIGVEKGVQLPTWIPDCSHHIVTNEDSMDMAATHPETLYWFCNIDPRMGDNSPDTDLSHFLKYYKERGARGVGELTCNLYFDDPRVLNLFKHCEKNDMPVTFHVGNPGYGDYGLIDELGFPRLGDVLSNYPGLKFLGHSQKFWAEISGDCTLEARAGYPSGRVSPGGAIVNLMRRHKNLCGDMSAGSGYNAITRDPDFGYEFIEEFKDRLFFGTDICDPRNAGSDMLKLSGWLDRAVEDGKISDDAYRKVCRENALALLEKN